MRRRPWVWVTIALAVAVAVTVPLLVFALGRDTTSERTQPRRTATTPATTTTPTAGPQTVPVPPSPPPPPSTGPPPAISVPPGAPRETPTTSAPDTTTRSTTPPTVTGGPATTRRGQATGTTRPARVTRKTVVYSPEGAPRRQATLVLPPQHADTIIVLVHGLAENRRSRKQLQGWADFYAEHGYPSFAIDYQLVRAGTPSPVYPKPETDAKAAVQFLRGRAGELGIDPDRIVVQGFSNGAALGAQAEVTPDDPFFDGTGRHPNVSDKPAAFVGFYGRYDGAQRDPTRYYGGQRDSTDTEVQERYAKADSVAQAANAAGPALVLVGEDDAPEYVDSATQLRDALQGAGKDVTLTLVAGAGHGFDQEEKTGALTPAGQEAAQQVLDWLAARFPAS